MACGLKIRLGGLQWAYSSTDKTKLSVFYYYLYAQISSEPQMHLNVPRKTTQTLKANRPAENWVSVASERAYSVSVRLYIGLMMRLTNVLSERAYSVSVRLYIGLMMRLTMSWTVLSQFEIIGQRHIAYTAMHYFNTILKR